MEKVCSGFGHRTVFGNIELAVQACVIQVIEMGCTVFTPVPWANLTVCSFLLCVLLKGVTPLWDYG